MMQIRPTSTDATANPMVSVVMPVRNAIEYIHEAINSVLIQSFIDFEILVMDDGSNDYDYKLLENIDQRIRVTRLAGNGVSRARNAGMNIARGDYFAFLDADDIWFPGKLAAQIRHFENHPEVGVVFGGYIRWEKNVDNIYPPVDSLICDCSGLKEIDQERSGWIYTKLLMGLLVGMNTAIIRRNLYLELGGFDESMRIGEDYDYWLRASRTTHMHALAGPVALYRIHAASAMFRLDKENHISNLLRTACSRWGLANPDGTRIVDADFNSRIAAVEFDHGYNHYWNGDITVASRSFASVLLSGYRPLRSLAYLIMSWIRSIRRLWR